MKTRNIFWVGLFTLIIVGSTQAQNGITLDNVVGLTGVDSIQCGVPVAINLRVTNESLPFSVSGASNGFRLYSPNGATWTPGMVVDTFYTGFPPPGATSFDTTYYGSFVDPTVSGLVWIDPGAGETPIFDGGLFVNTFSVDGQGADTVGFAGFSQTSGVGIYQSFSEVSYRLEINGFDCHGLASPLTFCIDSSYFPPAGNWLWSGDNISDQVKATWDGPHCFQVFDPSAAGAQIVNVNPNNSDRDITLGVNITGINTHFKSGSGTSFVRFSQGSVTMNASSISAINDTSLNVALTVPVNQPTGLYDLSLMTSLDGLIGLPNAFTVNENAAVLISNQSELSFIGEPNISLSDSKSIQLTSSGGSINFNVGNASNWLQVTPTSGATPATITASLAGFRPAGSYIDTILIVSLTNSSEIQIPVYLGVIATGDRNRITIDHVDNSVGGSSVYAEQPITFHLRYTGGADAIQSIENGFRIYSPDGAQWTSSQLDTTGTLGFADFDLGVWQLGFSNNGSGVDTVALAAVRLFNSGMRIGFDDIAATISIGPISSSYIGKSICIDSTWFPPAGYWRWGRNSGTFFGPKWDGPFCYSVVADTGSPPPPINADIAITEVNGIPIDSVNSLKCYEENTFTIRGRNLYNDVVLGLANGFEIYSPDGAAWTPKLFIDTLFVAFPPPGVTSFDTSVYAEWIDPVSMPGVVWNGSGSQIFDGGIFSLARSVTGSGADTIGLAGFVQTAGIGIPHGFEDVLWTITISEIDCQSGGKTLCIDSAYFPPSGTWKWSLASGPIDGVIPTFAGGKCFTIDNTIPGGGQPQSPITFDDLPANRTPLTNEGNVNWDHPDQYGFSVYNTTNATPYDGSNYALNAHGKNMIGFGPINPPAYLNGAFFAKCSRDNTVPIGDATSYPVDSIRFHFYDAGGAYDGVSQWYPLKKIPTWIPIERMISRVVIEHDTVDALDNYFQNVPDAKWFAIDHIVFNSPPGYEPPVYCEDLNNNDICDDQELPFDSTSLSLDYVDGQWGKDTVIAGRVLEFGLRLTNYSADTFLGIANGFRVYSPDGASWSSTVPDTTGALRIDSMMTAGVFVIPTNVDGFGADTVGFAGVAIPTGPVYGLQSGFSEVSYTIQIGPIDQSDAGKTICLDSSYFPPAGYWLWSAESTDILPGWDGPHCFTVVDAGTPVYPSIACPPDTVTALEGYNYEYYYTPTISNADTVLVAGPSEANARWINGSVVVDGPAIAQEVVYPITIIAKNVFGNDTCQFNLRVWPFTSDCQADFYGGVTITGLPYNIIVDPNLIWGCQLSIGDEIGVFDLQQDLLVGGGAYCDPGLPLSIAAWKADPSHSLPGYIAGNPIGFRIYHAGPDSASGVELCVEAFGTGVDVFESASYGSIDSMRCVPCEQTFCIPVSGGRWHTVSSPVVFVDPSAPTVFGSLEDLDIAQDDDGRVYVPGVVNTLSPVSHLKSFDVFVDGPSDDWCVTGTPVRGARIPLKHGRWNGFGYPVTCNIPIDIAMADVLDCIDIVQDDKGRVFIPSIPYNTIGDMTPGTGYKMYLTCNSDTAFQYPICGFGPPRKGERYSATQPAADASFYSFANTGLPYTILLQDLESSGLVPGTEIGVFDAGQCVGGVTYQGESLIAVTAWRADQKHGLPGFTAGNTFELKTRTPYGSEVVLVSSEKGYRFDDGSYAVISLGELAQLPTTYVLGQNYPNPFNPSTTIEFALPSAEHVTITVYNVLGQSVRSLVDAPLEAGQHTVVWDGRDNSGQRVSSGIYLYRMNVGGSVLTKKALLLK